MTLQVVLTSVFQHKDLIPWFSDRKKFSAMVFDVASSDLVNMGMTVISYTIKDIKDEQGYLRALGMARTAQVRC